MSLMDRYSGVDDLGLNGLFVNYWLNTECGQLQDEHCKAKKVTYVSWTW